MAKGFAQVGSRLGSWNVYLQGKWFSKVPCSGSVEAFGRKSTVSIGACRRFSGGARLAIYSDEDQIPKIKGHIAGRERWTKWTDMKHLFGRDTENESAPKSVLTKLKPRHQRKYTVMRFNETGLYTPILLSEAEIGHYLPLEARDIRLFTSLSSEQTSAIIHTNGCTLIKAEQVKAIIRSEPRSVYIFNGELRAIQKLADDLSDELQRRSSDRPYEYIALESILFRSCEIFEQRLQVLQPVVDLVLKDLTKDMSDLAFLRMLPLRKCVSTFEYTIHEFVTAMDHATKMCRNGKFTLCTGKNSNPQLHKKIDFLLEHFDRKADDLYKEIHILRDVINDTQQALQMSLDSARNRIMKLSLNIGLGALTFGYGSFVCGLFGMNLTSGLELHPQAFQYTISGVIGSCTLLYGGGLMYYFKSWTKGTEIRELAWKTNFYDKLNSVDYLHRVHEKTTREEFIAIFQDVLGHEPSRRLTERMFEKYDSDMDGELNWEEYFEALKHEELYRGRKMSGGSLPMSGYLDSDGDSATEDVTAKKLTLNPSKDKEKPERENVKSGGKETKEPVKSKPPFEPKPKNK
eukprot:Nk52_evm23s280 gene=Nk52_evmTU23s280